PAVRLGGPGPGGEAVLPRVAARCDVLVDLDGAVARADGEGRDLVVGPVVGQCVAEVPGEARRHVGDETGGGETLVGDAAAHVPRAVDACLVAAVRGQDPADRPEVGQDVAVDLMVECVEVDG